MRSERLTILVTPDEKAAMSKVAAGFKMSLGELLRYGFELAQEMGSPADLEAFAKSVAADMQRASARLDEINALFEDDLRARHSRSVAAE